MNKVKGGLALTALVLVLNAGCGPDAEFSKAAIFDGDVVTSDQAPAVVALMTADQRVFCTGAIIGDRWVLTASHCFRNLDMTVSASAKNALVASEQEDRTYRIKNIHLSEFKSINTITIASNGDLTLPAFDLALVEVDGANFATETRYKIAPVDVEKTWRRMRTSLTAYGYGLTDTQKSDDRLHMGQDFLWISDWGLHGTETYLSSAQALCSGDSGGPLVATSATGTPLLYGIAVRGTNFYDTAGGKCGYDDSIFTRLTHPSVRQWITETSHGAVIL